MAIISPMLVKLLVDFSGSFPVSYESIGCESLIDRFHLIAPVG